MLSTTRRYAFYVARSMTSRDRERPDVGSSCRKQGTVLVKKAIYATTAAILAVGLAIAGSGAAYANNATASAYWSNGVKITTNEYVASLANANGCGPYSSSAVIGATPNWVKDFTSFHANGIGASVSGVSISGSGADGSISWTNSNGARGSYLSGTVCINWLTWYLSMSTTGSAFYYGSVRTATAAL